MDLQNDLYAIKYEDNNIIYSPLRRALFFADDTSVAVINRYLSNKVVESDKNTQVWKHIERLEAIDVNVIDHIIVSNDKYFSFNEHGLME